MIPLEKDSFIRNPGQIKFFKEKNPMPFTYKILSWHSIYKGKTKQQKYSIIPNKTTNFVLYKAKTDIKICKDAH